MSPAGICRAAGSKLAKTLSTRSSASCSKRGGSSSPASRSCMASSSTVMYRRETTSRCSSSGSSGRIGRPSPTTRSWPPASFRPQHCRRGRPRAHGDALGKCSTGSRRSRHGARACLDEELVGQDESPESHLRPALPAGSRQQSVVDVALERGARRLRRRLLLAAGPPVPAVRIGRLRYRHFPRRRSLSDVEIEGDRLSDLERRGDRALSQSDAGAGKVRDPVSARRGSCDGDVSKRTPGGAALCAGDDRRVRLCAARDRRGAIYLMINPSKASYSMAPTMVVCALAGFLTAHWLKPGKHDYNIGLTLLLGFLLGLSVDFRLPNLFLSSGYFLFFLVAFLTSRRASLVMQGTLFAVAFLAGIAPTLISNAINAGSPLATTYGGQDVAAPAFSFGIVWQYLADMQFVLLALSIAGTAYLFRSRDEGARRVALVTAMNLAVNLAFFLSHPVFTPYYTIPIAMLSLWSLLFAALIQPAEVVDERLAGQAAGVRS